MGKTQEKSEKDKAENVFDRKHTLRNEMPKGEAEAKRLTVWQPESK